MRGLIFSGSAPIFAMYTAMANLRPVGCFQFAPSESPKKDN